MWLASVGDSKLNFLHTQPDSPVSECFDNNWVRLRSRWEAVRFYDLAQYRCPLSPAAIAGGALYLLVCREVRIAFGRLDVPIPPSKYFASDPGCLFHTILFAGFQAIHGHTRLRPLVVKVSLIRPGSSSPSIGGGVVSKRSCSCRS